MSKLRQLTGGASLTPLLVLFGLNLVDEFDRLAFATLTPEIRDAFGLSDAGIVAISVVSGAFVVAAAIPAGIITDRVNRVRLAAGSALLWGTMSVLTGVVPAVFLLFVVRLLSGFGRTANEIVHPSLLTDYYPPAAHPRVFSIHRLANPVGLLSALLAGLIGEALGWQWAFFLLAIPTFPLLLGVRKLHEPLRGATIDAELAEEAEAAEQAERPDLGEARRTLFAIRSLRRTWGSSFLIGMGAVNITQFFTLFFEQVHGFGSIARGMVLTLYGVGTVVGLVAGARLADRALAEGDEPALAKINGQSGFLFAIGLAIATFVPWSGASVAAVFLVGVGAGWFQPAYYPLVGRVAPPRLRGQAYAWAILFVAAGALMGVIIGGIGEENGWRAAMGILAFTTLIAGFISRSAHVFVRRDVDQADRSLATAKELRDRLAETGERALLGCYGVEVAYGDVQVLFGVDLEVKEGEIVALLGTNGAGKSTLLKAISGLIDPIGGNVFFDGRDVTHADARQTASLGIVQVPGGHAVFPTLTVAEHLRLAAWLVEDPEHVRHTTQHVLDTFPRLRDRYEQVAGNLSGGEQQMLAIGMALISKPKLLMIDELSLGLAPTIVADLLEVVREIRDQGTAIIIVEQSVNVALTLAERAYFLEKGEVRFEGPTADLLEREDILRSVFLAGAGSGLGDDAGDGEAEGDGADRASVGTGSTPTLTVRRGDLEVSNPAVANGEPLLVVEDVTKRYGGITAVDRASLTVKPGEIVGIIGPNGAGKTTLFDIISGFVTPETGSITLAGTELTDLTPHDRSWHGLGRSFQAARLVPSLSVAENLALGLERHLEHRDHLASALRMPGVVRLEEDVAWTVGDLVEMLGLGAYRDKQVKELSTGTRRVVDLGMVIAHDPTLLLLDEPSSGIAQRETEALGPLLKDIQRETNCALLVIEHDMPLITSVSDRLVAMDLGRPIAEGSPQEVIEHPQVVSAYLGGDVTAIERSGAGAGAAPRGGTT